MSQADIAKQQDVLGHPAGLYTLFFAEMWERFSYYGMRALLIFYMIKGFLGYGDAQAYTVYGAYTALVYMTPFIGGLLADKILGKRYAVVIGGLLMAAGHLLMTVQSEWPFFFALALLIVGNGFFKPNISTTVGSLYAAGDKRRDAGFNIFYTGINLGAAMSPLLCGYVGETYGWHLGFGLATIGMMIGLAVFVMPNLVTSLLIFTGAVASAAGMLFFRPDNIWAIGINVFVAVCLVAAAVIACIALNRGGLPKWAGGRPKGMNTRHDWKIYVGILVAVPIFALLVSGFSPFTKPPVDELTGVPVPVKTNEERMEDQVEFLTGLEVKPEIIAVVKEAGVEGTLQQRGKPYTIISEELINNVKGVSDKRVNKVLMTQMLLDKGQEVAAEATFVDIAKSAKAAGIDIYNADVDQLSAERQVELVTALEGEFGLTFTDDQKKQFTTRKELINTVNDMRSSFLGAMGGIFLEEVSKPAGLVLTLLGILAFGYLIKETFRLPKIKRERLLAALVLIFFQMLFFAFFEQAGSSVNNFTDRNIDRVAEDSNVLANQVGQVITIQPTQAQLGYEREGTVFTLDHLDAIKKIEQNHPDVGPVEIPWEITESNVGMGVAQRLDELPATIFQSFNAIFILVFALIFNWIWGWLNKRGMDPNAAIKFGLGLIQLGLGFGAFWMGAQNADDIGMVAISWLTLGILLQTTGELCLSPVGLSAMTKLSPKHLVSTLMGAWFLATAFSQYLAGVISQFTSVSSVEGFPPPSETVHVYGGVFKSIAITAIGCGLVCILISPILNKWMHTDKMDDEMLTADEA